MILIQTLIPILDYYIIRKIHICSKTDLLKHIFINEILELEGFNDLK